MPGDILTARFRTLFEDVLSPRQRDQAIDSLKDYIFDLQHGTSEEHYDFDLSPGVDEETVQRTITATLERCYWQLVMFLKSSRPSRISEAEPYLRDLLMSPTVLQDSTHHSEIHANLLLAAALSSPASKSTVARDSEAILLFSRYFTIYDMQPRDAPPSPVILPSLSRLPNTLGLSVPTTPLRTCNRVLPCKTELWARAAFAGLLQRLGLEGEAHKQTELIRAFIRSHPYALPIEKYHTLVSDLSIDFGLDLDPFDLDIPQSADIRNEGSARTSPASPTLSFPSSASTASDSSMCASPATPYLAVPQLDGLNKLEVRAFSQ